MQAVVKGLTGLSSGRAYARSSTSFGGGGGSLRSSSYAGSLACLKPPIPSTFGGLSTRKKVGINTPHSGFHLPPPEHFKYTPLPVYLKTSQPGGDTFLWKEKGMPRKGINTITKKSECRPEKQEKKLINLESGTHGFFCTFARSFRGDT